jgi:phage shock protein PspC (stress-responsive transcriptional regulator)
MKKTEQIHMGGFIFHIDEDASQMLNAYLAKLKNHFANESEASEIINDIEMRIAELLQLKLNDQKQVINSDDVQELIEIMGKPEDFIEEPENNVHTQAPRQRNRRRLYRDLDNNLAGGVCAGLGVYFNLDPVIWRIIFIVLTFPLAGFPILAYFILWIITPAALSTAQKMEMRGGDFTISDIESNVKREFEQIKGNFNTYKDSEQYKQARTNLNSVGRTIGEIVGFFGRILLILVGLVLILTGLGMITSMFGLFVFSDSFLFWLNPGHHHAIIPDFMLSLISPKNLVLASIALIIFVAAPVIAIIYWGLKLILRFKANDKIISLVGAVAWILSIVVLIAVTFLEVKEYSFTAKKEDSVSMNLPKNQTLHLKAKQSPDDYIQAYFFDEGMDVYTLPEYKDRYYFEPNLRIKKSTGENIYVEFEKIARGSTNQLAKDHSNTIVYEWNLQDSVLYIDPFFYQEQNGKWSFPELKMVLYLPEGQKICIDDQLYHTLNYIQAADGIRFSEIPGRCWIMTNDGLDYPN